ncbi:MAG: hypothetical protein K2X81_08045, partial [Candidatus Obscuribacterales bacterium]|nr:hypothetical protein [Candidatus Obscuribacterales bacterium]
GTKDNLECKIDSIAQSWSVLSGAASDKRRRKSMDSLVEHLVDKEHSLIKLLAPPFDKSEMNPGYIKGYVPGVRENGGQYTHAAIWATMAFAALGEKQKAWDLWTMINPVNHGNSAKAIELYKVEPYVVAADVYAVAPHTGRGGWTWYTGSASWMYRLLIESLLGIRLDVNKLSFSPCVPESWKEYKVHYRFHETIYHVTVIPLQQEDEEQSVKVDNVIQNDLFVLLVDDGYQHQVEVRVRCR